MTIKPMIRNNICLNSNPEGCARILQKQVEYVKGNFTVADKTGAVPGLALVIGCSNGYGLASRIAAAFGYGAATVGVSLEKGPTGKHCATTGFYNNAAFDREAEKAGLVSVSLNGDAYSDQCKAETVQAVRKAAEMAGFGGSAKIDLIVYSLASPVRTDPKTGVMYKSVIKPVGAAFSGKTLSMMDGTFSITETEPASEEEIFNTVKVMGGEDWELWMDCLDKENLLSPQTRAVAYTYIGPQLSWAIYKNGTIGKAKEDLERACRGINAKFTAAGKIRGAWVSVNKALVTRSSAVIPIIPFYVSCLYKVMKEKNLHENCIEQITRLYRGRLYTAEGTTPTDSEGRIRLDDWEMREDVQKEVTERMSAATAENVFTLTDIEGFKRDFLEAHGFDAPGLE
ncbi:MAG: trans-2-enoyl-CoA reductase family protein [Treponema sp.]|nr:trans-2-enoyl-CoA reductase family protein [Treponema sp.]